MCKLIIFLPLSYFSFFDEFKQYSEFNTCEINDITLQFSRNLKPYIKQFVK